MGRVSKSTAPFGVPRVAGLLALLIAVAACIPAPPTGRPLPLPLVRPSQGWAGSHGPVRSLLNLPPMPFEENQGQADGRVAYRTHAGPLTAQYQAGGVR